MGLTGVIWAQLAITQFTLAWQHTVEKVRWEEDYRVMGQGIQLLGARVKGSGAGMEVPSAARFEAGSWHYSPDMQPLQALRLARTPQAGDYQICQGGRCQPLSEWLGAPEEDEPVVELWACSPVAGR